MQREFGPSAAQNGSRVIAGWVWIANPACAGGRDSIATEIYFEIKSTAAKLRYGQGARRAVIADRYSATREDAMKDFKLQWSIKHQERLQ